MSRQRLGNHNQAGGIFIQTMNDAGARQMCKHRVIGQQPIEQGPLPITCRRVHHQTGGLVDYEDMFIFVNHMQIHRFRQKSTCLSLGQHLINPNGQVFAAIDLVLRLQHRLAIHQDAARFNPLLQAITGVLGNHLGQHLIEASALSGDQF